MLLPLLGFVKHIVPDLLGATKSHAGIRGAKVEKFPLSPFLWGVRFRFVDIWVGVLGGCDVEESVTQFWSDRGQEPAVELVMTRVNEDGLWWIGRVGEEKKSWGDL